MNTAIQFVCVYKYHQISMICAIDYNIRLGGRIRKSTPHISFHLLLFVKTLGWYNTKYFCSRESKPKHSRSKISNPGWAGMIFFSRKPFSSSQVQISSWIVSAVAESLFRGGVGSCNENIWCSVNMSMKPVQLCHLKSHQSAFLSKFAMIPNDRAIKAHHHVPTNFVTGVFDGQVHGGHATKCPQKSKAGVRSSIPSKFFRPVARGFMQHHLSLSKVISTTYYSTILQPLFQVQFLLRVSFMCDIRSKDAPLPLKFGWNNLAFSSANVPSVRAWQPIANQRQGAPFGVGNGRLPKRLMRGQQMYCKLPSKHAAASVAWFAGPSDRSAASLAGEMAPLDANIVTGSAGVAWSPQHPCQSWHQWPLDHFDKTNAQRSLHYKGLGLVRKQPDTFCKSFRLHQLPHKRTMIQLQLHKYQCPVPSAR